MCGVAGWYAPPNSAVWDRAEHSLYLARDRLGKKPLYVARIGEAGWLFASELKALCAMEAFGRDLDPAAVAAHLRFGFVPTPRTIFRDAWKLAPGTFSRLRFGPPVQSGTYWFLRRAARRGTRRQRTASAEHLVSELDELLRDAVSRRMVADVPVGVFLSGGIDSATVTALMQAQSARPVKTFSIGFHEKRYDEAVAAGTVARHLGTDHRQQYVSAVDARTVLPDLAEVYDEPFADAAQIPTLLVSRLARQSVTVALSGDGGDEVFAGYKHYSAVRTLSSVFSAVPRALRRPAGALLTGVPGGWWDTALALAEPILPAWGRNQRHREKIHKVGALLSRGCLQDDSLLGCDFPVARSGGAGPGAGTGRIASESARLDLEIPEIGERMLVYDQTCYLPDDILVMVDRASMAASLEVRSPLLDYRIVEWAWSLPFAMKLRRGVTRWLLRQVLHRYVPAKLVDRPKAGFSVPLDRWLRGPLRDWAEPCSTPPGSRMPVCGRRRSATRGAASSPDGPHPIRCGRFSCSWRGGSGGAESVSQKRRRRRRGRVLGATAPQALRGRQDPLHMSSEEGASDGCVERRFEEHWEQEACDVRYGRSDDRKEYFNEIYRSRYEGTRYLREFARFDESRGRRVLEIGVGAGCDFRSWVENGASVSGIDLTEAAIRLTAEHLKVKGLDTEEYELQTADAERLPFEDGTFDIVYSYGVIHHAPDAEMAMAEARRVLRAGGRIAGHDLSRALVDGVHVLGALRTAGWKALAVSTAGRLRETGESRHQGVHSWVVSQCETATLPTLERAKASVAAAGFQLVSVESRLCPGDFLNILPSARYRGWPYRLVWHLYPRWLVALLGDRFGLNLLIRAARQ